jgi:hypothetical protein
MTSLVLENRFYQNPPEPSYFLSREFAAESSYSLKGAVASSTILLDGVVGRVSARLDSLPVAHMKKQASSILERFREAVTAGQLDLSSCPGLQILDADDGSVLIEWQFRDRRLGFNLEPDEEQSGWYFAFSRDSGGQCGSGTLSSLDMAMVLRLMLTPFQK